MKEQSEIRGRLEKINRNSSPRVILLSAVIVIVAGLVYHFWPRARGLWQTANAALNKEVSLTAILYTEDNPLAVVDGQIVHEGDVIGGVTVVKIHKHKVEFEESDRMWTQHMPASEQGVSSGIPVLLELGSDRCPACRRMTPILNKLQTKYAERFQVRYIDVDKDSTAGLRYGVQAIPTQIFYDSEGREVFRHVGFYSKKDILATWNELGVKP